MSSALSERVELAKHCSSRDWSKAIRVLDSILDKSCSIQDICNRAFCYSQLELHKHVIKDSDKALQLESTLLQPYILKGRALYALGRKEDALLVLEQGHDCALQQSADLKQLVELEELRKLAKRETTITFQNHVSKSSPFVSEFESPKVRKESSNVADIVRNHDKVENGKSDQVQGKAPVQVSEPAPCTNEESNGSSKSIKEFDERSKLSIVTKDTAKMRNKLVDTFVSREMLKGLAYMSKEKENSDSQMNGTVNDIGKPYHDSSSHNHKISDETKRNKKPTIARLSRTKSISVDFRLSRGIAQVNEGNYAHAISIFDQVLKEDPTYPEALIGRGTAYAFKRELESAIADFNKAIRYNPAAGEAWKRRGQARAALGEFDEAIKDLTSALHIEPNSADILHERGIVNFKFKDFIAAVQDLSACLEYDKDNKSAYTYLGLALSSIGEYEKAEKSHIKSIQLDQNFLEAWTHLVQFYQDLANHKKALECVDQILKIDNRCAKAYHLRGLVLHGLGDHKKAIKELSTSLSIENSSVESLYLRASCYHAIGEYREAIKDYDAALDVELDVIEKFVLQCLAFYQKEIALYTASKVNSEFCGFDIDGCIDPLFKEYWCKQLHPKNVCEKVYRQPTLRESLKKGKLRKQDLAVTKHKMVILAAADLIGKKIQYDCPGFLPNKRQHRMAGLAAIEIAQKVSKAWRSLQAERRHSNRGASKHGKRAWKREKMNMRSQNRGGAGCSTSSSFESAISYGSSEDRSPGRSTMSWQDVYSLAVKWRQISEPCDPVVWVNKLSEEFNSGFGSHTPMVSGQAKVVRYFPNHERALNIAKTIIKSKLCVHNHADDVVDLSKDGKLEEITRAETCADLHKVVGEDFWLATWCNSTAFEGKKLDGTRIACVKKGDRSYDFGIRTPCTPARWDDFDSEMTLAWEALCNAYCGEAYGSTNFAVLENVRDAILRMTYYWYNFMPLSRGTAAVGFAVLLGLLLAANMEFTGSIPKGLQVDWEAILTFEPNSFVDSIKTWLYPALKVTTSWKDHPEMSSAFPTTGSVVAALSSYSD